MTFRTGEIDPNTVRPGWVALLIVLALAAVTVLLWRNMGKQLKKIDFDLPGRADGPPEPPGPDDPADRAGAAPAEAAVDAADQPDEDPGQQPARDAAKPSA